MIEVKIKKYLEKALGVPVWLEVGKELKDVERNVSITNLRTAVLGVGKPTKETVKTTKTVKKTVKDNSTNTKQTNGKLDPFIDWFKARKGKVRYSMANRYGPNSYDCSSAVHYAARHAGLIPSNHVIGSTETLFDMKGKYLDEISRNDIRFGDIFVAGRQGTSGGAAGHTGAVIDKGHIIHCTYSKNGIAITPINGYTGGPPVRWFRWKNSGAGSVSVSNAKYWTNSNLIYHDLGFKLNGLTAGQLNNWVKATSPGSPFIGQGNVFMEAQKQSGLDARYILAHAALESAWGRSNIAKKWNNYFGIGAFDNDPNNAKNFSNSGLASGIINGAKWIAKNYYNSSYKQTTLYKMRHNNGVHQYATDPNWHTKIANIMKRSERYTNPASPSAKKEITETVTENKEIDKDTNLIGYKYDDGRYFVDSKGRVCDREANAIWSKPNTKGRYLTRTYSSEATSQKTLFDECLNQLKKHNSPEVSYDVKPDKIPKDLDIGDRVRIIDHNYGPALYLDARLVEITTSSKSDYINNAVFANFIPRESGIAESLLSLQTDIRDFKYSFDNLPYEMEIESSSGNIFKDDIVDTTLIANLTKAGIDQSANVDGFIWERISKYLDKLVVSDEDWNKAHEEHNEHFIELTRSDIELEASFVCTAMLDGVGVASASYTIKNLSIGIYKQKEEPDRNSLMWGDVWQWDDGDTHFKRIWKGDRWEDTVTKRDLELLEFQPGPPGKDGEDGMPGPPGKDGRTSYVHFAYADSADGKIGFTLTATPGKEYIGFYTDFEKADSKDPSKYEWSRYKGEDGDQGIPGKAGEDGKTPYFHTAWANSSDGKKDFSINEAGDKKYIGTYTDFKSANSTNPNDYKWMLVKGEDGNSEYVHIAYANFKEIDIKNKLNPRSVEVNKQDEGFILEDPIGKSYSGISIDSSVFEIGKKYFLTFNTKTLEGKTKVIGGHSTLAKNLKFLINNKEYNDGNWGDGVKFNIANTKNNYFKISFVVDNKNNNADFYIQFNRTHSSSYKIQFTELKLYEYTNISKVHTNEEFIGFNTNKDDIYRYEVIEYDWSNYIGKDGKDGKNGLPGRDGKDGENGKTGKIGQNLLRNSNITVSNLDYNTNIWHLCETPKVGEDITITLKIKVEKDDSIGFYNSGRMIQLTGWQDIKKKDEYQIISYNFKWKDKYGSYTQNIPPLLNMYIYSNGNGAVKNNHRVYVDWIVLTRGDIPAIEWTPCYADMDDAISKKADQEALQDLEVHFSVYPSAEELKQTQLDILKQKSYLDQLKNAIESNALSLEDRIAIIEANVGAGKLTLEAITTYLNFGEEGVLIGKEGEQVRLRLINNALEITDGTKVVARFANNQTETPNLKVSGAFEFGYHVAGKMDKGKDKFTIISPNI